MKNNAVVNGSIYSNGNIVGSNNSNITGDVFLAGAATISGVTVGGAIQTGQPSLPMPISAATIQAWKNNAAGNGDCVEPECTSSGDFLVTNNQTRSLDSKRVIGKIKVDNGATLVVTGTIWVLGDLELSGSNGCNMKLAASYGGLSGAVIGDSKVVISNNCNVQGSGDPASYLMLLADKNSPSEEVMVIDNNSVGAVYYASGGWIKFSNNAAAKEATAYGIRLDNGATITYESGLADAQFSSGPSGGWNITGWGEVVP